jgi:hypothetical protein
MFFHHQFLALFGDCICLYIGLNGNRGPPFMSNHPPPVVSVSGLTWLTTKDTGDISVTIVNFHFFLDCDVPQFDGIIQRLCFTIRSFRAYL